MSQHTNPYRKILDKNYRLPGQQGMFVGASGEINASNRHDLLMQINALVQAAMQGDVAFGPSVQERQEKALERRKFLLEAINDPTNTQMKVLGEAIAAEIQDTATRDGFCRRLMQFNEVGEGANIEVRLRQHDTVAYVATSTTEITPSIVRNRKITPPEFNVSAYILIDLKELASTPGDLLEEKYDEGLEMTMLQEDRLWRTMASAAAVVRNTLTYFPSFTPQVVSQIRTQVVSTGLPATSMLIAYDIWNDIIGNTDFSGFFDPVTKYELLQQGTLGTMLGMAVMTDTFRQQNLRCLTAGEVFVVGPPINHGVIQMRGSMLVEPVNKFGDGIAQRGWFMNEIMSMVLGNANSIAKGIRL